VPEGTKDIPVGKSLERMHAGAGAKGIIERSHSITHTLHASICCCRCLFDAPLLISSGHGCFSSLARGYKIHWKAMGKLEVLFVN
jgi:hypothetical protein